MNSILSMIDQIDFENITYGENKDDYITYICHYDKLVERKNKLLEQFKSLNMPETKYEFITDYDRNKILEDDVKIFDVYQLRLGTICVTLTHILAYIKLVKSHQDICLVLEDDVIFSDNFSSTLDEYLKELPKDWDMLFIGDGCQLHIEKKVLEENPDKHVFLKCTEPTTWGGDGITRCTDSYIINKKAAIKILHYIKHEANKIYLPIDWHLNVIGRQMNLKVYWAEPTIVTQNKDFSPSSHLV